MRKFQHINFTILVIVATFVTSCAANDAASPVGHTIGSQNAEWQYLNYDGVYRAVMVSFGHEFINHLGDWLSEKEWHNFWEALLQCAQAHTPGNETALDTENRRRASVDGERPIRPPRSTIRGAPKILVTPSQMMACITRAAETILPLKAQAQIPEQVEDPEANKPPPSQAFGVDSDGLWFRIPAHEWFSVLENLTREFDSIITYGFIPDCKTEACTIRMYGALGSPAPGMAITDTTEPITEDDVVETALTFIPFGRSLRVLRVTSPATLRFTSATSVLSILGISASRVQAAEGTSQPAPVGTVPNWLEHAVEDVDHAETPEAAAQRIKHSVDLCINGNCITP